MMPRSLLATTMLTMLIISLACGGGGSSSSGFGPASSSSQAPPPPPPAFSFSAASAVAVPNWEIQNLRVDDSCSSMFDYCVTVSCDVVSKGGAGMSSTATMTLEQNAGQLAQHQALTLSSGQRQSVSHQFKEAELFGSAARGGCMIAFQGTEATCSVTNNGGAGSGLIKAQIILNDGSDVSDQRSVRLQAGESQDVKFMFNGLEPSRALRVECEG